MSEQARFNFHDERYTAVGELVIKAALDARARLGAIEAELFNSEISGHANQQELEERKAHMEQDAAKLGAIAVQIDPNYVSANGASANGEGMGMSRQESPAGERVERLLFRNQEQKAKFHERTSRFVHVMVGRGNIIDQEEKTSAGIILKEAMGMDNITWNNFATRLQAIGILVYEREQPYSNKIARAYMNRERVEELIRVGDLPEGLAEELAKLDEIDEPQQPKIEEPETTYTLPADLQRRMRNELSSIRTRRTGAHVHQRVQGA